MEEDGDCQVHLHWNSMHDRLAVSNTSIQDVQGLSIINMRLLEQRGAVGKPIPPLSFGKMIISMASEASKLNMQSNYSMLHTFPMAKVPAV